MVRYYSMIIKQTMSFLKLRKYLHCPEKILRIRKCSSWSTEMFNIYYFLQYFLIVFILPLKKSSYIEFKFYSCVI